MSIVFWWGVIVLVFAIAMGLIYFEVVADHANGEGPLSERGAVLFGLFCIVASLAAGVGAAILLGGSVFAGWGT